MPDPEALREARHHRRGLDWRAEVFVLSLGFIGGALGFAVWEALFLGRTHEAMRVFEQTATTLQESAGQLDGQVGFLGQAVDAFCT